MKVKLTTLVPIFLIASLAAGVYFLWPKDINPPKLEDKNRSEGKYPLIQADLIGVDKVELKNIHGNFTFRKEKDGWFMISPIRMKTPDRLWNGLMLKLSGIRYSMKVSDSPKQFKTYLVDNKKGLKLSFYVGESLKKSIILGKSRKFTLIREDKKNDVWQATGSLRQLFVKDLAGWFDPELVKEKYENIEKFETLTLDGNIVFSFEKKPDWKLVKGPTVNKFSPKNIERAVKTLLRFNVRKINNDVHQREKYLKGGPGKVRITSKSGQIWTFTLGVAEGQYRNIAFGDSKWLGVLFERKIKPAMIFRPEDVMDSQLFNYKYETIKRIEGRCRGSEYEIVRNDAKSQFKYIKGNATFVVSPQKIKKYSQMWDNGVFKADIIQPATADLDDARTGFSDTSDFLEVEFFDGKKVRYTFGKEIPADMKGYFWTWTKSDAEKDFLYKVERKPLYSFCLTRLDYMAPTPDPDNVPLMPKDKGAAPGKIKSKIKVLKK